MPRTAFLWRWTAPGAALLAAALQLGAADADPPRPTAPKRPAAEGPGLQAPKDLSPVLRELLHRRMEQHGVDMTLLSTRVILLRYDEVISVADRIAAAPRLLRGQPGDGEDLGARLPPRIFLLDEELRERARRLSDAARARDDAALGRSFGLVAETCVACHSAYRGDGRSAGGAAPAR